MTHPNAALLRRGKEAFVRGEIETVNELIAEDILIHTSGVRPFAREYRGREAFLGYIRQVMELSGGTYSQKLHDVIASDDHAVALVTAHATRNGRSVEYHSAEVFHIRDGRATEAWFMNDLADPEFWI